MVGILCPCGSDLLYATCCQPFHLHQANAPSAEKLMRSRYSAFALQHIDYLIETTAKGQQAYLDRQAIQAWSEQNQWLRLEIVATQEKLAKYHAQVEFKAHYHDAQAEQIHHEISHFIRVDQRWYFLDPTLEMSITMKQPCICGSGKKFKQCCAPFL